jgi:hypothetical protein
VARTHVIKGEIKMAKGMKIAKGNSIQIDSQIGPQLVTWANSTATTTFTALGGVGGDPSVAAPRTIQVHYKTAAGLQKNDGFIVKQRGRKQFDVQSVSGGATTRTRCTLVESGTLAANQMYITFGYNGQGTQYAFRITNRFVWTNSSNPVRYEYTCGLSAEVGYIQATAGTVFYDKPSGIAYPIYLAVVESQN